MRVVNPKVVGKRESGIDIKFSNGMREFICEINKPKIKLEDIVNDSVEVRVYSFIRNCCAAAPMYVLESGLNETDDSEIKQLLNDLMVVLKDAF